MKQLSEINHTEGSEQIHKAILEDNMILEYVDSRKDDVVIEGAASHIGTHQTNENWKKK